LTPGLIAGRYVRQNRAAGPVAFHFERALFQRAIGNLVGNALPHTPPGGRVVVSAGFDPTGLAVSVADMGCAIAAEHVPHLFDRFYRVEASRSPGQGLGLAIVRSIVELLGGTASAVSIPTTITLRFPRLDAAPGSSATRTSV